MLIVYPGKMIPQGDWEGRVQNRQEIGTGAREFSGCKEAMSGLQNRQRAFHALADKDYGTWAVSSRGSLLSATYRPATQARARLGGSLDEGDGDGLTGCRSQDERTRMTGKTACDTVDIRAVVLVGRQDFGRCPLAARLPAALWPIAGKPVVERLLCHLADEGVRNVALCCGRDILASVGAVRHDSRLAVRLVTEELSSGTAGCLRDATGADPGDLIIVFSGSIVCPPPIRGLVESHMTSQADLTVVFNPDLSSASSHASPAEIYLCRPDILKHIPAGGYCDIKEGLIPAILRAGGTVKRAVLSMDAGNFHGQAGFMHAMFLYLRSDAVATDAYVFHERSDKRVSPIACGEGVDPEARIYGPVAIADGVQIAKGAVIVGPAILDRDVRVGPDSIVAASALWEGAEVGANCEVRQSLIERDGVVYDGSVVTEQAVPAGKNVLSRRRLDRRIRSARKYIEQLRVRAERCWGQVAAKRPAWAAVSPTHIAYIFAGALFGAAFLWSYWPTVGDLWEEWQTDEYSAGLLVPFLTLYVLWTHRERLARVPVKPAIVSGVAAFAIAQTVRGLGLYKLYSSAEMFSIILSVTALVILLLGWPFLRKLVPVVVFLCLMLPWPHRVQAQITLPLQGWATDSAVFCLESMGYEVAARGNVIEIGQTSVAVAEACNGLRMITAFLVISGLVVLLVDRAWWEKLIVLASSLPVAMFCNTLRLTITAILYTIFESDSIRKLLHDSGGFAMMPLALALVIGELWLLKRLVTPQAQAQPAIIARRKPQQAVDS